MEAVTLATLAAMIVKIMTVIKSIGKDNRMALTQVLAWVVGSVVVFLAAQSTVAENLVLFGTTALGKMNFADCVLAGVAISSTGSFAYDFKKARDNNDSAAEPALLGNSGNTNT